VDRKSEFLIPSGQNANTIVYENLCNIYARLHPSTIPQLVELSIPADTGGSNYPMLREANGQFNMLTLPVIFTEKAQTLGTRGDIML